MDGLETLCQYQLSKELLQPGRYKFCQQIKQAEFEPKKKAHNSLA